MNYQRALLGHGLHGAKRERRPMQNGRTLQSLVSYRSLRRETVRHCSLYSDWGGVQLFGVQLCHIKDCRSKVTGLQSSDTGHHEPYDGGPGWRVQRWSLVMWMILRNKIGEGLGSFRSGATKGKYEMNV